MTPSERAQRDADKVFKWILIHADKPRKPSPTRDDKREERRDDKREDKPVTAARAKPPARAVEAAPAGVGAATAAASLARAEAPGGAALADATSPAPTDTAAAAAVAIVESRPAAPNAAPLSTTAAIDAIDEILTPLFRAEPQFPANLLRTLRKGTVQLQFTVLTDGSVAQPAVVTSTNARLNPSALAAIAQWRFAPLRKPQLGLVALGFDLD